MAERKHFLWVQNFPKTHNTIGRYVLTLKIKAFSMKQTAQWQYSVMVCRSVIESFEILPNHVSSLIPSVKMPLSQG